MKAHSAGTFNMRAFVAWAACISGVGLPLSGYANHLLQFHPMTVERHAWMAAHSVLGLIFAACAVWHALLNRRTLLNYARGLSRRVPTMSREALLATGTIIALLSLVVGHAFLIG